MKPPPAGNRTGRSPSRAPAPDENDRKHHQETEQHE